MVGYDIRNATVTLNPSSKLFNHIIPKDFPGPRWNATTLVSLARLALPLGFVTMLISFNSNIPRYFIEGHLGSYQLGIFAAIASFQKVAPTVVQALGRSASPRLAKYYAAANARAFRKLSLRLVGIGVFLGAAGVLVALVLGRLILTLFYGPEYAMTGLFGLLMVAAGIDYIATMLLFVITSARYFRIQLPLQILTTGAVALACFWLVPSAGLEGAAMALIIGNLFRVGGSLIAAWHAQRTLHGRSEMAEPQASAYSYHR
jgi:O-antigen/teichoic acid export membrane protein